jgi:hypothetical protein
MAQAQPCEKGTDTEVEYLDLRGLSTYSSLAVPTLREYLRDGQFPYYKVKGKIVVKKSEFVSCMERFRVDKGEQLDELADDVMEAMKN